MPSTRRDPPRMPFPDKTYSGDDRRRVLVECSDPCLAWAAADVLKEAGYDVATCWALGAGGPPRCPVVNGERCALVDEADVIVRSFAGREIQHHEIVEAVARAVPDTPVCFETPDARGWACLAGAMAMSKLTDAVGTALESSTDTGASDA